MLPNPPDSSLRQPLTLTAVIPLYLCYYALAVLAILPNTSILKLSLLPFIVWQAWTCAVGLDFSMWLAQLLGLQSPDRLSFWNCSFVVRFLPIVTFSDTDLLRLTYRLQCCLWHSGRLSGRSSRDR